MKHLEIAVAIPKTGGHCRNIIRGIFQFARQMPTWNLRMYTRGKDPDRLLSEGWDGCIWLGGPLTDAVLASGSLAVVDVSNRQEIRCAYSVDTDDEAVGRMAATFFLEQGFGQFAFAGMREAAYSRRRETGFVREVERMGYPCSTRMVWETDATEGGAERDPQEVSKAWLKDLPKPIGLFACSDAEAFALSRWAEAAGVRIPEDVALLGVDNDDLVCCLPRHPLSSIQLDGQGIGKSAAALLAAQLEGQAPTETHIVRPPLRVVLRDSCRGPWIADPHVRTAQAFIRAQALMGIRVPDVVRASGLNRRALEIRYREETGRTLNEGILAVRMELARHLVAESDLSMKQVAQRCAFRSAAHFATVFRQETGQSPTTYREHAKPEG